MKLSESVGSQIQKARKKKKYTLEEVANKLDYNLSSLSKIERGDYEASYQTLIDLANIYEVEIAYFFNTESVNTKGLNEAAMLIIDEIEENDFNQLEVDNIRSYIRFIKYERNI